MPSVTVETHYRTCPLCEAMCGLVIRAEGEKVLHGVRNTHGLDGVQLSVAKEFAGVNNNLLAPGELVDEISGNAIVNGIKVEVVPVPA